jgi:hypothetical protein
VNEVEEMRGYLDRAEKNLTRMRWILQNPESARDCINRAIAVRATMAESGRNGELGLLMLSEMDRERAKTGVR